MRFGNKQGCNRGWLRAAVVSSALLGAAGPAIGWCGEPLERLGRTFGLGWGDGYHACTDSCPRLGADLPPRSFTARHRANAHGPSTRFTRLGHHAGTTFYDHFDADSGACDACAPHGCDSPPQILIEGSQVIRGHQPPRAQQDELAVSSPATPPETRSLKASPRLQSSSAGNSMPVPNLDGFAAAPRTMIPGKPYPRTEAEPRAGISAQPVESPQRVESDTTPDGIAAAPVPSKTPGLIRPVHPGDLVAIGSSGEMNPISPGGLEMPAVTDASVSPEFHPKAPSDDYVLNQEVKSTKAKVSSEEPGPTSSSGDAVAIAPPKTRLFRAPLVPKSNAEESVAAKSPSESELAETEGYQPTANRPTYASAAQPSVDAGLSSSDRPHRLGAASGPVAPTIAGSWSREKAERGVDPGPVMMNPFASRPTVELAERPSESSDGVIYQPNSSSTKR